MKYLYVNNHIAYAFLVIAFMLSTLLIQDVSKGHQIAIRWVRFHL